MTNNNRFTCPRCRETLLMMLNFVRHDKTKLKEIQRKYLMLVRYGSWVVDGKSTVYCRINFNDGPCCYHLGKADREKFFNTISDIKTEYLKLKQNHSCDESLLILSREYGKSKSIIKSLVFRRT